MKFYYHPMSGASHRALAFITTHKIDVELVFIDLQKGAHKQPDYLAINPMGAVPTLVDGDFVLRESAAILRYLAATHAPEKLGTTRQERGIVDQSIAWGLAHMNPALAALNAETGLKIMFGGTPDPEKVKTLTDKINTLFAILSKQVAQHNQLLPTSISIADYLLVGTIEATIKLSGFVIEDATIKTWFDHITGLEGWPKDDRA